MKVRKFKKLFTNPPDKELNISLYDLKDYGMDTIQSLSLLLLKEEAGHSLISDVFKMREKKYLNDKQTKEMILSILELYKARYLREDSTEIISTPMKLRGFKTAYEMLYDK